MHLLTKPLALASLLLLVTSARAADPTAAIVDLKAPQAIELVRQQAKNSKANPAQPALTVLDVRTPEEFAAGHLSGAQNVDFQNDGFKDSLAKLDKTKPYLVHCASGRRSAKTRDLMKKLGFTRIYHLDGGLTAWKAAGGQVVQTDPAPAKP
jgi:rhodanese-related sulfurtransferase